MSENSKGSSKERDLLELEVQKRTTDLQQSEWRLRQFVEQSPFGIVMLDKEMKYIFVSEKWLSDFHLKADEIRGKSHYEIFPEIPAHWRAVHQRCMKGSVEKSNGEAFIRADGTTHWVRWEVRPWYETQGNIGGILVYSEDISEFMKAQFALTAANTQIQTILDSTPLTLWAIDSSGIVRIAQGNAMEASGIHNRDVLGYSVFEFYQNYPEILKAIQDALAGHSSTHQFLFGKIWFEIHLQAAQDRNQKLYRVLAVLIDITESKRAEDQLRQTELQLTTTFNLAAVGMAHVAIDGHFLKVNQKLCDILGYSETELKKVTFHEMTYPQDLQEDVSLTQKLLAGEIADYTLEKRYVKKDQSVVWANLTVSLVRFADGKPNYFISVVEDINEKVANRQALQNLTNQLEMRVKERTAELERSNHELEQFAYVASHDLREPLRVIGSYTQLFEKKLNTSLDPKTKKYMGYIVDSVKRMDQLITDLLAYSRVGRVGVALEEVDSREIVETVLANLKRILTEAQAEIEIGELPHLVGSRTQLIQLFQNLIGNSVKYRSQTRTSKIRVTAEAWEDGWKFSVADNGIGIDPQFKDRIFLMFQRLHQRSEYPGTGIGLAICKKIVESYGGKIWVESEPDHGSTFYFTFPKAPKESVAGLKSVPFWQRPTHGRTEAGG